MADPLAQALELLERHQRTLRELVPSAARVVDAHTHLGLDEDGRSLSLADHLAGMDANGVERAFVFALNEPDREPAYRAPNDRILRWAAESGGRLIPFVRLMLDEDPLAEARRCVARGARGIKLHPRAQAFRVDDPRLEAVFAYAADERLPILIHAGRGLPPGMAEELARVADRHPEAPLILAHAAITEQAQIGAFANGHPNILFDTSTWTPLDILALFARVGPEQIVFASDVPYGDQLTAQHVVARVLRHAGVSSAVQRAVLGETALGLVEGRLPARISPPIEPPALEVGYDRMRIHTYLAAAVPLLWSGQRDLIGFLGLAAAVCTDGDRALAPVGDLILSAQAAWLASLEASTAEEGERRRRVAFKLLHLGQALSLLA